MVLGLAKNKWHVPVQILGTALFVIGIFLAHAHNGRNYVSPPLLFSSLQQQTNNSNTNTKRNGRSLILHIDGLQIL